MYTWADCGQLVSFPVGTSLYPRKNEARAPGDKVTVVGISATKVYEPPWETWEGRVLPEASAMPTAG